MKNMRKLIPAFAMLMVSAILMSTASFAWFSMSTSATANGMKVQATASSSLVITGTKLASDFATADQDYDFQLDSVPALTPITHNGSNDGSLYAPENTNDIDPVTGALKTGNDLVAIASGTGNYYDFKVYVAAAGTTPISMTNLNATVTIPSGTTLEHIHNAITIDFWVATVTNGTTGTAAYQGRTNLLAAKAPGGSTVALNQTSVPQLYGDNETAGDSAVDCLEITMRVYFDGALLDNTTNVTTDTYVRNLTAVLDAAGFSVQFNAVGSGN